MSPGALDRKMCSSSVEPTPSRMSTPKRAFQALPTDSGSASPAEVQMRSRVAGARVLHRLVVQHRGEQRRHAVEDGRVVLVHQREHRRRRRPLRIQHRGGADRHREGQRIAEPVGEEQFCRGKTDVVLANAEHLPGIGFRRRLQIGMQMPHALGHAGRARRIEPERRLLGMGRARLRRYRSPSPVLRRAACGRAHRCRTRPHIRDPACGRRCPSRPDRALRRRTARARGCRPAHRHIDLTSAAC